MNNQPFILLLGLMVLGIELQTPAHAQEASLRNGVVSAGGGPAATDEHHLQSTVGTPGIGIVASTDYTLNGGFWPLVHPPAGAVALPVVAGDAVTTDEDVSLTIRPLDNDIDPAGGPLAIAGFTQPDNGMVEQVADSQLTYTPKADFHGPDSFTYTATNEQGGSDTATVTVTVNPVNDAPRITTDPVTAAAAGHTYIYTVEAEDVDGDAVTLSASMHPPWLAFMDNGDGTAVLEGMPTNAEVGVHDVVLQVGDGEVTTEQMFTIAVVLGAPNAPVLTAPEDGSVDVSTDVTLAWNSEAGAATYDLQLSTVEDFSSLVIDTTGLSATSLDVLNLTGGTRYLWRVRAANAVGTSAYAGPFQFTTITNVATEADEVPDRFFLEQNYPNPFNPSTTIAYALPAAAMVKLVVYNVFGHEVATLVNGTKAAGRHETSFRSEGMASGVYLYRIEAGDFEAVRRMLLVK